VYIRVTSRCNMRCGHCCFACTENGEDMSWDTFEAAIECAYEAGDHVVLGGGEPTLHPRFFDMLALATARVSDEIPPLVVTNGSIAWKAVALARMAKGGAVHAALSRDVWHDEISPDVVRAFTKKDREPRYDSVDMDLREIRTAMNLSNSGRCDFGDDTCPCDDIFVMLNGAVHQCGCDGSPRIGDVFKGYQYCGWDEFGDERVCVKQIVKWRDKRGKKKVRAACA